MAGREMEDGESLGDVFLEPGSEQRSRLLAVGYDLPESPLSLGWLICVEEATDTGSDSRSHRDLWSVDHRVPHQMELAALPRHAGKNGLSGSLQPAVAIADDERVVFTSAIVPPYLRKSRSVEESIPWLYLKGVSTGDYAEALQALLGPDAKGLSPNVMVRLKEKWGQEYEEWSRRDLSYEAFGSIWADGIHVNVRL